MSGGIDSSVAAALLKEQGFEVIGVTMKIYDEETSIAEGMHHGCYGPGEKEDIQDAYKVAQILNIPLYVIDLRKEYKSEVLDYFCCEYMSGRTPNPCVKCNSRVKFNALIKKAQDGGIEYDYFATGHYARVDYDKSRHRYLLKRAVDSIKDQSYFLFSLSQEQLSRSVFPLGYYAKEEVKRVASVFGLEIEDKVESQDFISGGYSSVIKALARPGPILNRLGNIIGQHQGITFYTIGQRRGLGISAAEPLYVSSIEPERNALIVGTMQELYRNKLIVCNLNWIAIEGLEQAIEVKAKIRSLHTEAEAVIFPLEKDKVYVRFKEPQMAITPGQAVVFYNGNTVVGGGTIERTNEQLDY